MCLPLFEIDKFNDNSTNRVFLTGVSKHNRIQQPKVNDRYSSYKSFNILKKYFKYGLKIYVDTSIYCI